jgi:hypothetical protein
MAKQVTADAAAAAVYQAMVAAYGVAGGAARRLLMLGVYRASVMMARLIGAATAPPISA